MSMKRSVLSAVCVLVFAVCSNAQRPEVSIILNEAFFDAALDAVFQSGRRWNSPSPVRRPVRSHLRRHPYLPSLPGLVPAAETIKIQREINGVRTAVRFREGKILAPLAFSGNYNPPFLGCVAFSGWAEQ